MESCHQGPKSFNIPERSKHKPSGFNNLSFFDVCSAQNKARLVAPCGFLEVQIWEFDNCWIWAFLGAFLASPILGHRLQRTYHKPSTYFPVNFAFAWHVQHRTLTAGPFMCFRRHARCRWHLNILGCKLSFTSSVWHVQAPYPNSPRTSMVPNFKCDYTYADIH